MKANRRKDSKKRVLKEGEYERPNGTYEYRWRDRSGKRQVVYAKTLEELRDKENDVLKAILSGKKIADKSLTVNDMYERWVQLKRGIRGSTFEHYQYIYKRFVRNGFGGNKVCDLRKSDIRAFYNSLYDEKNLKIGTIEVIHNILHQVLEIAVEDECLQSNPSDKALKELKKVNNVEKKKRKALTLSQQKIFEEFLCTSKYSHWQPIFVTMLYTGMRAGEISGLQWSDVDFENGFISVSRSLTYYPHAVSDDKRMVERHISNVKTASGIREIPLLPIVRAMLQKEKDYQEFTGVSCTIPVDGYSDFIFLNRFGNPHNLSPLDKTLERIVRDCNYVQISKGEETLPPISCHILRHTYATRLCEAGVNLKAVQEILGHKNFSITMDVYTDATKELKKREAISLEEFFKKINEEN